MTTQSVATTSNAAQSNKNVGGIGADGNSSIHSSSLLGSRAGAGAVPNASGASDNQAQKNGANAPLIKTEMINNNIAPRQAPTTNGGNEKVPSQH